LVECGISLKKRPFAYLFIEMIQHDHINSLILRVFKLFPFQKEIQSMPMTKTQIVADPAEKATITKKEAGIILGEIYQLATKAIKKWIS